MGRGYINVGIPPGLVRDIRELTKDETMGHRDVADTVKTGARLWVYLLRLIKGMERTATKVERLKKD